MPFTEIPSTATAAGKSASSHLAHCTHKNKLYLDSYRQCITALQSTSAGGHLHTTGTLTTDFNIIDYVKILNNVNDKLDFYYGGGSHVAGSYTANLSEDTYSIEDLVTHIQARMRAIVASTLSVSSSDVKISVTYDSDDGSNTRGKIIIKHTGTTDSTEARVLKLLFSSGANGPSGNDQSCAPFIGFSQRDRIGAFGYVSDSGFLDGFLLDTFTIGDGYLVPAAGVQSNAATTAKFASGVISTAKLDDLAVGVANVNGRAITGSKFGQAIYSDSFTVGAGSTVASGPMTVGTHDTNTTDEPSGIVYCANDSAVALPLGWLSIVSWDRVGTYQWQANVKNWSGSIAKAVVVAY